MIEVPDNIATFLVALQITSPIDMKNLPDPSTAGQQAPGTDLGVSSAKELIPDAGKAAKKLDNATPDLPSVPSENPFDSIKSLFGQ